MLHHVITLISHGKKSCRVGVPGTRNNFLLKIKIVAIQQFLHHPGTFSPLPRTGSVRSRTGSPPGFRGLRRGAGGHELALPGQPGWKALGVSRCIPKKQGLEWMMMVSRVAGRHLICP